MMEIGDFFEKEQEKMTMLSSEYISKIYGSVLGKIVGVRLGNPMEFAYTSAQLQRMYPFIDTYLETEREIYTDDDTNGFVFFAKIFEHLERFEELTPDLLAHTILNYACENRGFFWWDYENGTESVYFRGVLEQLSKENEEKKRKKRQKESSNDQNKDKNRENIEIFDEKYEIFSHKEYLADYVGGQIFYDAIGLIFAGKPQIAARFAGTLSKQMHSKEGYIGAEFICACVSAAFVEQNIRKVIERALECIPSTSRYAKMVRDIISVYERHPYNWTACQHFIEEYYDGHAIWDYAAAIVMALLYGRGDFSYSMEICLKSGGDTDCNCGNLGSILGAFRGAEGISYKRWVYPLRDTLHCSSALPYENEVSITQFAAYLMVLFAKWNSCAVPDYIQNAAKVQNFSFAFLYSYQNLDVELWRKGTILEGVNRKDSLWLSSGEVETLSGSPYALKFWAHQVEAGDCVRFSKRFHCGNFASAEHNNIKYEPTFCTKIFPGQTIRVKVRTYDNSCDMQVRLVACWEYRNVGIYQEMSDSVECECDTRIRAIGNAEIQSKKSKVTEIKKNRVASELKNLQENIWTSLELTLPCAENYAEYMYNCIEIEVLVRKASYYNGGFDGIAIYLDELAIEGEPRYVVRYSKKHPPRICNTYHYPMMENFTVCYGEVYHGFSMVSGQRRDYCRFFSGDWEPEIEQWQYRKWNNQPYAQKKKLAMAFTGPYVKACEVFCKMSVRPRACYEFGQDKPTSYETAERIGITNENCRSAAAALLAISVRGILEHFAVGFYGEKIAILKAKNIPGEYDVLAEESYTYDLQAEYLFSVKILGKKIEFSVAKIMENGTVLAAEKRVLSYYNRVEIESGCIGFVGVGDGIVIYEYGVR